LGTLAHCPGLEVQGKHFAQKQLKIQEEGAGPSSKSSLVYRLGRRHRILWGVGRFGVYGVGYRAAEEKWAEARAIAVSLYLAFSFKFYIYSTRSNITSGSLSLAASSTSSSSHIIYIFPHFRQYPAECRYRGKRRPQLTTSKIHAPSLGFRV